MNTKKKIILVWVALVACIVATVVLWFAMNGSDPEFEEVKATVISSETEQIVNRKTGSRTTIYKVKVRYEGEEYDLKNAHGTSMYPEGKVVTAYLANGKLYANEEGVKTSTPLATVYFIFLFGSFAMLFVAPTYTAKWRKQEKEEISTKKVTEENSQKINENVE